MCEDCTNMVKVCCKSCKLCTKCTLESLKLEGCHELITKLVNGEPVGDVCEILLLRLSVILLGIFKNFDNNLTDAECKEIDKGNFMTSRFRMPTFCNSWAVIQKTFQFAITQVLDYLKDKVISEKEFEARVQFIANVLAETN